MAKNKRPTKRYTPKPVEIPITSGLRDELAAYTHFSLMSMEYGEVSVEAWKKIAKVVMTVSFATDGVTTVDKADKVAIDSAVLTLKAISDREVRTGKWYASQFDIESLRRGVTAADKVVPALTYSTLKRGYIAFVTLIRTIK